VGWDGTGHEEMRRDEMFLSCTGTDEKHANRMRCFQRRIMSTT
jgi:hypothetical protein